ncbi:MULTISPECIES: c-type cytochrome [Pseudomonas]|uniref:c-type cytochrome n=1 Tax=Pseudomonas TaxID=286 RepID=UPI0037C5235A
MAAGLGQSQTTESLHNLQIQSNLGARVYADNCKACHRSDGQGYAQTFPELAGNGVLNEEDPTSVIGSYPWRVYPGRYRKKL